MPGKSRPTDLTRRSVLAGAGAAAFLPVVGGGAAAAPKSEVPPTLLDAMRTGFNLPNVCDLPPDQAELPDRGVLRHFNSLGFRHIRLPVDPAQCIRGESAFVRGLDAAAARILDAGFALSLDIHPGEVVGGALRNDPRLGGDLVAAALRFVAARAKDLPADRVAIELLNEPPLETTDWRPLRQRLVSEVREQAPSHTIVWCASKSQTIEETVDDPGPDDRNAIAAVHYYYPMVFTHQGQTWGSSPFTPIKGLPFPFSADDPRVAEIRAQLVANGGADSLAELDNARAQPWTSARVAADFSKLATWSSANGWPVVVNEFGVFREFAPKQGRGAWLAAVRIAAEAKGFGWCHWEFDKGFGFTRARDQVADVDPEVIAALFDGGLDAAARGTR